MCAWRKIRGKIRQIMMTESRPERERCNEELKKEKEIKALYMCIFCIFFSSFEAYKGLHFSLVSFSMLGFIFFDLLYIAVVINYASQCQLLTFYIENIRDKIINKQYKTLSSALKVKNYIKLMDRFYVDYTLICGPWAQNSILPIKKV